eukprot:gene39766-52480_t
MAIDLDYRTAFDLAPIGMVLSRHRLMVDCNQQALAMFCATPGELIGLSFETLYPTADEYQRTGERISASLDAQGRYADDRVMKRRSGELFWCHVSGRALDPADPHAAGIWSFEDLSSRRVLKVDFTALAQTLREKAGQPGLRLRVVGNLPYNISTPILFHLLGAAARVEDQHFMLQKEVVERMAASPGSKAYGRLSVMLQWRYDIELLVEVPPESFDPPPRVDSAVVRMVPLPQPAAVDVKRLEALVASAFSQRRKLLRHSLGKWLEAEGFKGEFNLQRRAEEVPVAEFVALAQALPAR